MTLHSRFNNHAFVPHEYWRLKDTHES